MLRGSLLIGFVLIGGMCRGFQTADREKGSDFDEFYENTLKARGIDTSTKGLISALKNPEPEIRDYAAIVIGERKDKQAIPPLRALLNDPYPTARFDAARSLAVMGDKSGLAVLKEQLKEPDSSERPLMAAATLAEVGDPSGYNVIIAGLASQKTPFRVRAVIDLATFSRFNGRKVGTRVIDVPGQLIRVLEHDPDGFVRLNAALILGRVGNLSDIPALKKASSDSDQRVRQAAQTAIETIKQRFKKDGTAEAPKS